MQQCEYKGQGCAYEDGCSRDVSSKDFHCGIYPYMRFLDQFSLGKLSDHQLERLYELVCKERSKRFTKAVIKRMHR